MRVCDLIEKLQAVDSDLEVVISMTLWTDETEALDVCGVARAGDRIQVYVDGRDIAENIKNKLEETQEAAADTCEAIKCLMDDLCV